MSTNTDVAIFSVAQNPELGRFVLPRTFVADQVTATSTDGHEPATDYVARLYAIDTSSRFRASNLALARTSERPVANRLIYGDEVPGWAHPPCFQPETAAPYAGDAHYQVLNRCEGDAPTCALPVTPGITCWENMNWGFSIDLGGSMNLGQFTTAFVEFALSIDGNDDVFWGAPFLETGASVSWDFAPLSFAKNQGYRRYQVRLSAFRNDQGVPLSHDELSVNPLTQFGVGAFWADDTLVRIDEVRLFW